MARPTKVKKPKAAKEQRTGSIEISGEEGDIAGLVADLVRLGFSDYEAKLYIALTERSPLTAYQLGQATGVPRPNVYSALDKLVAKQAVQRVMEQPARYIAVAPQLLFDRISRETAKQCSDIGNRLSVRSSPPAAHVVLTVSGKANVELKIAQMIRESVNRIWLKASEELLEPHRSVIEAAASRGVQVLIILFGSSPHRFDFGGNCNVFLHDNNGLKLGVADNMFTVVRDSREALTANVIGECYGVYSVSPPLVMIAELLLRKDVYLAEIMAKMGDQVDEAFGPYLLSLRRRYFPESHRKRFEANISRLLGQRKPKRGPAFNQE